MSGENDYKNLESACSVYSSDINLHIDSNDRPLTMTRSTKQIVKASLTKITWLLHRDSRRFQLRWAKEFVWRELCKIWHAPCEAVWVIKAWFYIWRLYPSKSTTLALTRKQVHAMAFRSTQVFQVKRQKAIRNSVVIHFNDWKSSNYFLSRDCQWPSITYIGFWHFAFCFLISSSLWSRSNFCILFLVSCYLLGTLQSNTLGGLGKIDLYQIDLPIN